MTFLYTARGTFARTYDEDGMSWDKSMGWYKLTYLTEKVELIYFIQIYLRDLL